MLLNELGRIAKNTKYRTIFIESHDGKALGAALAPPLRETLYELNRLAGAGDKVRRALAALRGFVGSLRLKVGELELGLDIDPAKGVADSGDLEVDLPDLFVAVGEAAEERGGAVAILIDELQYFTAKELSALIMAMHKMQQLQLPVVLVGAGLPILVALAGESKSYTERLFDFPDIDALSAADAAKAVRDPAAGAGVAFEPAALTEIYRLTQGYPYFVQEWGYQCWNMAAQSPIVLRVVGAASSIALARLDKNFFRVRLDRLTPSEKRFLRGMAELGAGPHKTKEIVKVMNARTPQSLNPVRAGLIRKGMVYSPAFGDLAFTVPLFDEFMVRAVPDFRA